MTIEQELLFAERPEWKDVVPVEQYDGVKPLAPVFYTPEYKDATDYFRGIVKTGEMSPRVLSLTENVIRQNPAHYSAWQYRYKTLLALDVPLDAELALMDELAVQHLKTYQVWHHRRLLVQLAVQRENGSATSMGVDLDARSGTNVGVGVGVSEAVRRELTFTTHCLHTDTKNYHTWSYRQWLLAHFCIGNIDDGMGSSSLWADEYTFVGEMLAVDVRNNSAWHHRFVVVFQTGVRVGEEDREEVVRKELTYAESKISLAPNNASAWNYLRGVLDHSHTPYSVLRSFVTPYCASSQPESIPDLAVQGREEEEIVDLDLEERSPSSGAQLPCVAALEFMADIHEQECESAGEDGSDAAGKEESLVAAIELWSALANTHDKIRHKYWESRIREAKAKAKGR